MRSIWSRPPGGFTAATRRHRRARRIRAATAGVVVLALGLVAARGAVLRTEPITQAEALQTYRADTAHKSGKERGERHSPRVHRRIDAARPKRAGNMPVAAPTPSAPSTDERRPARSRSAPVETPRRYENARPLEGVYTWDVRGFEETSGGTRRELPPESHRIITHSGPDNWIEHHIFSDHREEWFEHGRSEAGLVTDAVRNRVAFGPVEVDRTVTFEPRVLGARAPFQTGDSWSGKWTGRTEGEYEARIFEHLTMVIDGQRIEVWGSEVLMTLRGEIEGEVLTRSWIAPSSGLTVKQEQRISIQTGHYEYHSEWIGRLRSLRPAR